MELERQEIVGQQPGPHLLITGGVHGDEFEPMAAVRHLMRAIRPEFLHGRVTLVPVVNEPAFRRGQRTAEDGLDLARTCPGREDGSVTERIAWELSKLIRSADYYIDLHTGGTRLTVLPLTGYTLHKSAAVLETQRRMANAFGLPLVWGTDPNLEGRSLSVARDANVPAIYAEYLGGGRFDPAGVEAYVRGCLEVMRELGLVGPACRAGPDSAEVIDQGPARQAGPTIVEDPRPGAGHMQVNHPSPVEGFFTPAVTLGQKVKAGDALGTVCDPLGHRDESVRSRYTGIVIVLHTFPRVEEGTSVAVVLETPT
ncbi:MAG TPA: M14 family metallopeptidase [Pirellulaceae bacterium]|nr:M14 family metallopeptidase [Pirellulaceae bacterium]